MILSAPPAESNKSYAREVSSFGVGFIWRPAAAGHSREGGESSFSSTHH